MWSFLCFVCCKLGLLQPLFCFIHQFCLQLETTSCGFVFNSSYHNIIDYRDNLATISQNIMMFFWLLHRPTNIILHDAVWSTSFTSIQVRWTGYQSVVQPTSSAFLASTAASFNLTHCISPPYFQLEELPCVEEAKKCWPRDLDLPCAPSSPTSPRALSELLGLTARQIELCLQ